MTDSLSLPVYAFASRVLISISVDKTQLPKLVNLSSFRKLPFSVKMSSAKPLLLKYKVL